MSLFANISIIRRIALILFGLVMTGYMVFLLYAEYRSQSELQKYYTSRLLQETEKRATAVSYFFSERANDMKTLAESRELSVYFENLALGMSMEYGLSASLLDAESAFRNFREKRELEGKKIFSRVIFLDQNGLKLIDTDVGQGSEAKGFWKQFIVIKGGPPAFFAEGHNDESKVILSLPYLFKGKYTGQIIALISPDLVFKQFIVESGPNSMNSETALISRQQYLYSGLESSSAIPHDQLPPPEKLFDKQNYHFIVTEKMKAARKMNAYPTPVGGTPLALVTFIPETERSFENSPELLILITGGIGIIILFGSFIIIRTTLSNAILNTRLAEISVREKAIAEKNRSLRKLTAALEQSANSVVITDTDGVIEYVNPYFTQLTGYAREEAIGKALGSLMTDTDSAETNAKMRQAIISGEQWNGELQMRKKSGEQYWEYVSISPVRNHDGQIISCVTIRQDITKRKLAEDEIIKLNAELEQRVLDRTAALESSHRELGKAYSDLKAAQSQMLHQEKMASIGQLAAGVAHEINNPIGFMLSNLGSLKKYAEKLMLFSGYQSEMMQDLAGNSELTTEMVLKKVNEQKKSMKIDYIAKDIVELIDESVDGGDRVKKIVQNLKTFAHLDEAEHKPTNLNDALESTINIVWNELKYKASLIREFGDIPETRCNSGQINQVFLNMLVNSAQSIEKHGEIKVRTWLDRDIICISFSDTGCGIPPDKLNRIFEPFFTTKEVGQGTGLGLSISYDIIKEHNGEIMVVSEENKGSTFTIKIPVSA
jgi:two-component system NtrC family sensor kinase